MTHLNSDRCNAPAQFSLHRAPHVVHYRPRQYTTQHARYPSRQAPTFKNVVIGSSALRICSWKKYARSPSQPSAGHCAARHRDQHPSLPLQRQNTKERREFFFPPGLTGHPIRVFKFGLASKHCLHLFLLHWRLFKPGLLEDVLVGAGTAFEPVDT